MYNPPKIQCSSNGCWSQEDKDGEQNQHPQINDGNKKNNRIVNLPHPDYFAFSVYSTAPLKIVGLFIDLGSVLMPGPDEAVGIPMSTPLILQQLVSVGAGFTIDRNGQVYITMGGAAGKTLIPGLNDPYISGVAGFTNAEDPKEMLSGFSFSHGMSGLISGNYVWSPSSEFEAAEIGYATPSVNIVTFSVGIPVIRLPFITWSGD